MPDSWPRRASYVAFIVAATLTAACAEKTGTHSTPPTPPQPSLIALLPDPETGITGKIQVSNEFGGLPIVTPRGATLVKPNAAPGAVTVLSEEEVARLFGAALAALPPAPTHFTLYFEFDADTLTEES